MGRAAGDELLQAVADGLEGHVRPGDTVARCAGDEFVVVWPSIGAPEEAEALVQRLQTAMVRPFELAPRDASPRSAVISFTAAYSFGFW